MRDCTPPCSTITLSFPGVQLRLQRALAQSCCASSLYVLLRLARTCEEIRTADPGVNFPGSVVHRLRNFVGFSSQKVNEIQILE